jgi:hypothetical protein
MEASPAKFLQTDLIKLKKICSALSMLKIAFYALLFTSFIFNSKGVCESKPNVKKFLKEAENLTLIQDRLMACTTLYKVHKKFQGAEAKQIKDKLFYLASYFYTDKGLQDYLVGKEFFENEKYQEASEKLVDSDNLEKGNTDVLHYLTLSYLWLKNGKLAEESNLKALQINPLNAELLRDKLIVLVVNEKWKETYDAAQELIKFYSDNQVVTQTYKAVALIKTSKKDDAKIILEGLVGVDGTYPEVYYWLSQISEGKIADGYLQKYNDQCKNKKVTKNQRDVNLCSKSKEKAS